jgi:ABC-type Zn uptake system ZnuABC Zn-binding protein ZnuA
VGGTPVTPRERVWDVGFARKFLLLNHFLFCRFVANDLQNYSSCSTPSSMKRISVCLLLLQGLLLLSAAAQQKIKILTTFAPAYAFASNVAGTAATVENLLPPHASLHDYTLSPRDLRKLHSADILILNGAGLETWIAPALKTLESKPNLRILQLADGKELLKSHHHKHHEKEAEHHHHHHGDTNPHIWLDPIIAMECVGEIADFLANADPNNADL